MELLIQIAGALVFFALIMTSIALHEVGHLIPAKLFGVRTTEYFVGFGPTLWSTRRGETEYGVKWLPLGGYVRMIGMYPPARDGSLRRSSSGLFQGLADSAREFEAEDIRPGDEGRLFHQRKPWQKIIVMAGGPLMNLVIAFLLFQAVFGLHGTPMETTTAAAVPQCFVGADRGRDAHCTPSDPRTPAAEAGLRAGDRVVAFNGRAIDSWKDLSSAIRANGAGPAAIVVERDGREVALRPTHTVLRDVPADLDSRRTVQAGYLGLSPTVELVRGGPLFTLGQMGEMTARAAEGVISLPVKVVNAAVDLVTGKPRDVNGPMSIVGASRLAGDVAATERIGAVDKIVSTAMLLGAINLFVAVLNLVPLMPFDGGHIVGALWEWLRKAVARMRGRPDPGYVDVARTLPIAYVVGGFLAVCGVVLVVADIVSPMRIF